ncbi:MAG: FecR domain-containing protein [Dysgonomonas sp.]|nr:FecR domain-containing protein [Dysgonomonas sp.]
MKNKYNTYTSIDFLYDQSFLRWVLFSDNETNEFWGRFLTEHPHKVEEINEAKKILKSLKINSLKYTDKEKSLMLDNINNKINKHHQSRKIKLSLSLVAVACIAFLFVLLQPSLLNKQEENISNKDYSNQSISNTNKNDIQLILANNESVNFKEDVDINYDSLGQIVVSTNNQKIQSIEVTPKAQTWNKLIVPKGKRSSLILPDGSKAWINSGSTLEFPPSFNLNKREILVEGEIYIEVKKNERQPFVVKASSFDINVLGTRFNISAYKEEIIQYVVLVEGSVSVTSHLNSDKSFRLEPDQILYMTPNRSEIRNVDVYDYISWKDGLLRYKNKELSIIFAQLSRHYDIPIKCAPELEKIKCSGKLVLFDDIEDVLKTINDITPISWKTQNGKIIIVKK